MDIVDPRYRVASPLLSGDRCVVELLSGDKIQEDIVYRTAQSVVAESSNEVTWSWPGRWNDSLEWITEEWTLHRDGRWYMRSVVDNHSRHSKREVWSGPAYIGFADGIRASGFNILWDDVVWTARFNERTQHTLTPRGYLQFIASNFDRIANGTLVGWHGFGWRRTD